jgi:hypothetical protein
VVRFDHLEEDLYRLPDKCQYLGVTFWS